MWETIDPDGRQVVLPFDAWLHILEAHPDVALDQHQILLIVEAPERRLPGREAREEWFYRSGMGPSRWVKVVVHFGESEGRIVTAFARRKVP
jgi:hypothetical protein